MIWALEDAEDRVSKLVKVAESEGPQIVTVRGERAAVVLSARDYDVLKAKRSGFVDALLGGPEWDEEMIEAVSARAERPSRDHEF